MSVLRCTRCSALIDSDDDPACFVENPGLPGSMGDQVLCEPCRDREESERDRGDEPRCTCLRRDQRYMDSPYDTPDIIRRDPSCEVHGRDPDRERDARIDRELEDRS